MSMFFCSECGDLTDGDNEGCESWEGQLICERCYHELCNEEMIAMRDPEGNGDWASPGRGK